jgi:hypothetical protein
MKLTWIMLAGLAVVMVGCETAPELGRQRRAVRGTDTVADAGSEANRQPEGPVRLLEVDFPATKEDNFSVRTIADPLMPPRTATSQPTTAPASVSNPGLPVRGVLDSTQ